MLTGVGYYEGEITDCLQVMRDKSLVRFGDFDALSDPFIHAERPILEVHYDLLTSLAYTDNMAIVTPVEKYYRVSHDALYHATHRRLRAIPVY